MLVVASTLYHASREKKFVYVDMAIAVIVAFLYACTLYLRDISTNIALALLVFMGIGLLVRYAVEDGDRSSVAHGIWHVLMAFTLTIATIAIA